MNARASTSNPPPKFTKSFVAPSDSLRSQSFASSPIRASRDGVPPAKRRRLASTPTSSSLSLSTPRSSSSRPEQPASPDLHDARAASSMRVLNIWSALAERYNRRLDEDDIVDIRTGEVVKDRGVLSELPKRYNFGDLADKDDDTAITTDPGSEAADHLAEDEEDDDDEDEDDAEETDAFPSSDDLVTPQITRLAPLRPATSSSDADDLREFLKAEAIRRELDGGDDSSEDEFNILPPRSTPAKRTMTPARKTSSTARAKSRPLKTPAPDTESEDESEDEFAVFDLDRNVHGRYRARRMPSSEVLASIPSSPPPSSSPGPSSFSLPSSPLSSHTPLNSDKDHHTEKGFGSPTPKRQPLASTSRKTLEECLNEIDMEFPPPQPRAPSVFGGNPGSAFIIDLSLSDDETEDERPQSNAKSGSRTVKKTSSTLTSKRPIPFVLIETKRPTPVTSSVVASGSTSAPIDLDPATPPKRGRPRAKSLRDKPPDPCGSQNSKRGKGSKAKLVKEKLQEEDGDVLPGGSIALKVDETPITWEATKKVKSPSLSPARSDSSPKAKMRLKPNPKGRRSLKRLVSSDDDLNLGSESSPTKRIASSKSSPGPQTQVTTLKPDSKPGSTRKSATKQKYIRPTRSTESCASTTTTRPKSKISREPPEVFVVMEDDDRSPPPLAPSPSPAPSTRPRVRGVLKRKRGVSSEPGSGEEQGSPEDNPEQQTSPPDSSRIQPCTTGIPKVIDVDRDEHSDNPEAGELKPQTRSQSRSKTKVEVASAPVSVNTIPVVTPLGGERREDDTPNRPGGSYTHFPMPMPLPTGFPSQTHQPFTPYSGHPPTFQDHPFNFNNVPHLNHGHDQYGRGSYPLFQDPSTQALLTQTVTRLAILMNGGNLSPQITHMGGMTGNIPTMNRFPGSPGWGVFPAWSPSTPTTSRYPYGHNHQQQLFQSPYVTDNQMGGGVGSSIPPSTSFPPPAVFPSSLSLPESLPAVQQSEMVQEGATNRARSRSKSKWRVTFAPDPRSGPGRAGGVNGVAETSKRGADGSPPMTRGRSRTKDVEMRAPRRQSNGKGKSKVGEGDQGPESGSEEGVDRHLAPKSRREVRGRTPGPGR